VSELFTQSRSAAGSRSILSLMREDGEQLGRFKVRSLMRELDLVSKQPGSHAYKRATVERLDIRNTLNREFDVPAPIKSGAATSPIFGRKENGITWLSSWICALGG
jgi:putative transposase